MDEAHHKPEAETPTTITRGYTVGYVSDAKYQPVPAVTLKGHWLAEMGFVTGTPLTVKVLPGCLIISVQEPELPAEPEVVTALRRACKKMSARRQQQVMEYIEVITTPKRRSPPPGTVEWRRVYPDK